MSERKKITVELDQLTLWRFGTLLFAILFVASWATGGFGTGEGVAPSAPSAPNAPSAPAAPTGQANVNNIDLKDNYFKGDSDAKVTIIEFSDFQCPFCSRFYTQTLTQIEETYVDTGKVKFYYADFPLESIHPQALPSALAARCAGAQGKFWEYHDLLFENQQSLGEANYKKWANDLGLDTGDFDECLDSKKFESDIRKDLQDGSSNGITGTPGFIVNNRLISGAQPFSAFQAAIDAALAA